MKLKKELYIAVRQTQLTVQKKEHYLEIPQIVNRLAEQIATHTYQPGPYTCFAISDPTPREILAPSYPDRIVHRWLVNKMEPYIDKRFLDCSYANRTGKGHHRAVKQLQCYLQNPANKYYLKMDIESFFNTIDHAVLLQLVKRWLEKMPCASPPLPRPSGRGTQKDTSLNKEKALLLKEARLLSQGLQAPLSADEKVEQSDIPTQNEVKWRELSIEKLYLLNVCQTIITHNPTKNVIYTGAQEKLKIIPRQKSYFHNAPGKGLPLGNLSSQFFANIYLHELDWFVKHKLPSPNGEGQGVRYYLRYVDDIVLLAENTEQLTCWRDALKNFLKNELKLNAHPKKTILQPACYGIDFLGYIVRKDYLLVRRRVVKNFKRKLYFFNRLLNSEKYIYYSCIGSSKLEKMYRKRKLKIPVQPSPELLKNILCCINSYYGISRFANTYKLRRDIYLNHFKGLQKYFYATNHFEKIGLLSKYKNLQQATVLL